MGGRAGGFGDWQVSYVRGTHLKQWAIFGRPLREGRHNSLVGTC